MDSNLKIYIPEDDVEDIKDCVYGYASGMPNTSLYIDEYRYGEDEIRGDIDDIVDEYIDQINSGVLVLGDMATPEEVAECETEDDLYNIYFNYVEEKSIEDFRESTEESLEDFAQEIYDRWNEDQAAIERDYWRSR